MAKKATQKIEEADNTAPQTPTCETCRWSRDRGKDFTLSCLVPLPPPVAVTARYDVLKTSVCALHQPRRP